MKLSELSCIKSILNPTSKPRSIQNSCPYLGTWTMMSTLWNQFAYSPTCKNIVLVYTMALVPWWRKSHRKRPRKLDITKRFSVSPHRTLGGRKHSSEQALALLLAASRLTSNDYSCIYSSRQHRLHLSLRWKDRHKIMNMILSLHCIYLYQKEEKQDRKYSWKPRVKINLSLREAN